MLQPTVTQILGHCIIFDALNDWQFIFAASNLKTLYPTHPDFCSGVLDRKTESRRTHLLIYIRASVNGSRNLEKVGITQTNKGFY